MVNIFSRVILYVKSYVQQSIDDLSDGYLRFQEERRILNGNLDDLMDYTGRSVSNAINHSVSKVETAYASNSPENNSCFIGYQGLIYSKLQDVDCNMHNLERILSGQASKTKPEVTSKKRHSRFKSAYISTVAGIGTAARIYGFLRTDGKYPRYGTNIYSLDYFNTVIDMKNKYFWKSGKQLTDLIYEERGIYVRDLTSTIKDAMRLKTTDPVYKDINRINYDSSIASKEMNDELVDSYIKSDKSLKEIASDFEKRYGMHVSVSTISVNARKTLSSRGRDFRNRREAREFHKSSKSSTSRSVSFSAPK